MYIIQGTLGASFRKTSVQVGRWMVIDGIFVPAVKPKLCPHPAATKAATKIHDNWMSWQLKNQWTMVTGCILLIGLRFLPFLLHLEKIYLKNTVVFNLSVSCQHLFDETSVGATLPFRKFCLVVGLTFSVRPFEMATGRLCLQGWGGMNDRCWMVPFDGSWSIQNPAKIQGFCPWFVFFDENANQYQSMTVCSFKLPLQSPQLPTGRFFVAVFTSHYHALPPF